MKSTLFWTELQRMPQKEAEKAQTSFTQREKQTVIFPSLI